MSFKKMYWIEDVCSFYGPSGLDYTAIGRVSSEDDLKKDGTNWEGCSENYNFKCYETLEDALNSVSVRPSSLRWNDSLTEKDMEIIREWAKENEPDWVLKNKYDEVKKIVTSKFDNQVWAEYELLLNEQQNQKVQCNKKLPLVKVVFDKRKDEVNLLKLSDKNLYEKIDESEPYFEEFVKFACNSVYRYQVLFTDMDMRSSYIDSMKNHCMQLIEENMLKDYEER